MTSVFLDLPTDLQICILQTWLVGHEASPSNDRLLVKLLSVLDVAVCNHSLREPFLELASSKLFSWWDQFEAQEDQCLQFSQRFVQWLSDRRVALRSLTLDKCSLSPSTIADQGTLTAIRNIKVSELLHPLTFFDILKACPNADTLTVDKCGTWDICAATVRLRRLRLSTNAPKKSIISSLLCLHGPTLEELYLPGVVLTSNLVTELISCQFLQALQVNVTGVPVANVRELLLSCKELRKFGLCWRTGGNQAEVQSMLAVCREHFKGELSVCWGSGDLAVAHHALQQCPQLHWEVGYGGWMEQLFNSYDHTTQQLRFMRLTGTDARPLNAILAEYCTDLRKLTINIKHDFAGTNVLVEQMTQNNVLWANLQELELRGPAAVCGVLRHKFDVLKRLDIACSETASLPFTPRELVANLPVVEKLSVHTTAWMSNMQFSDESTVVILSGCKHLKELMLRRSSITHSSLRAAVLDRTSQLERFEWGGSISPQLLRIIRWEARQCQRLPVPLLVQNVDF